MDKILIESYSQLVINSLKGLIRVSSQIINHVMDIVNVARNFIIFNSVIIIGLKIHSRIRLLKEVTVFVNYPFI